MKIKKFVCIREKYLTAMTALEKEMNDFISHTHPVEIICVDHNITETKDGKRTVIVATGLLCYKK
jgi:hypothetical protein